LSTTDDPAPQQSSSQEDYAGFAAELYESCIISDPWIEGRERFSLEPVILSQELYERFKQAGEAVALVFEEMCGIVWERPELLDSYFNMTPWQKTMWMMSGGRWHGIARLDLFLLPDGSIQICEMNSDTPSGEAEAVVLNRLRHRFHPGLVDPNANFEESFVDMCMESYRSVRGDRAVERPSVGIVYPTDLPEDLSMIELYRGWFESRGCSVTLGSPYNIHRRGSGGIYLFDTRVEIILRHYKTDWWSERIPSWSDEAEYDDPDPLDVQLRDLLEAESDSEVAIINPFGAVLTQNKLGMAFFWDYMGLFSEASSETIRLYIPESHRLIDTAPDRQQQRNNWVLKSDYGCEGAEVVVGPMVSDDIWTRSLEAAIADRWIIQRYFDADRVRGNMIPNYGLYLLGGRASGIFTRLSPGATDYGSVTAPTFLEPTSTEHKGYDQKA
jgi:glutathionylspermidine synthase